MIYRKVPWVDSMRTLRGEFRRSPGDNLIRYGAEAVFSAMGGYYAGSAYIDGSWSLVAFGLAIMAATWFFLIRRNGVWYKFDHGSLSAYASDGTILWREDLGQLTEIRRHEYGRGNDSILILRWPDHRRFLPLYRSLEHALTAASVNRNAVQTGSPRTKTNDPEQKPWQCGSCGEENPGAFEVCWNCEKLRTELR